MTPTTDEPLSERVGRYRLLALLGAGGMGTVYRAHDEHLDRIVALKVSHLSGTPEQQATRIQRFQREARAAARVLHPNVCPIFDVGVHEGRAFVVMAFIAGPSLAQVLETRDRFEDVAEAIALTRQILNGLAAIHTAGIIHRDVKPANILLDHQGHAVLTDFGLARPEESAALTSDGMILGTPAYMAPEQASAQSDRIGPHTDIYAVGVVLYRMVTGHLPFNGPGAAVLAAILHDEPTTPRQFRSDLEPAIEAVILRAMKKYPEERFRSVEEMTAALQEIAVPTLPAVSTAATVMVNSEIKSPAKIQTWWLCVAWLVWFVGMVWWTGLSAVVFGIGQGLICQPLFRPRKRSQHQLPGKGAAH